MSKIMATESPKRRRWLQFRLRTLLIAVLVLSLPLSWFAVRMEKARRQKEAVETIERLGGYVGYAWQYVAYDWRTDLVATPSSQKPYPAWLRGLLGDNFFFDVVVAGNFPSDFDADDAACLKGLVNLEQLFLDHTSITDAGLENINGMSQLTGLTLDYTQVTDAGLEHVEGLANLEYLGLGGTSITDNGLEHLKGLTRLRGLSLNYTQVTDAGLEHLKGLSNLEMLSLSATQVTDAGLEHLKGLSNLEVLSLSATQVTDAGLRHLEGLRNLEYVSVIDTNLSPEGIEKLQEALPNCKIVYENPCSP